MMWAVFVVPAIGSVVAADDCCSAEDKREVQRNRQDIWNSEFSRRRVTVAQAVSADLFENNPGAVDLFERVNGGTPDSPEFKAHCVRVVNGLDTTINLLDSPSLRDQVAHLNFQHSRRSEVTQAHFSEIGKSFLKVLPQVSSCFNPGAFQRCFTKIAEGISQGLPA